MIREILSEIANSPDGQWLERWPDHVEIRDWIAENADQIDADPWMQRRATAILLFKISRGIVHNDEDRFDSIGLFGKDSAVNRALGGGFRTIGDYLKHIEGWVPRLVSFDYFKAFILEGRWPASGKGELT